ncbi:MAG TPA: hypothetical protein VFZ98_02580 [Vicinamibacterales bacterium]
MKATIILIVLAAVITMAVLAAQAVEPSPATPLVHAAAARATEPLWMVVSGAALLGLASALRRYMP